MTTTRERYEKARAEIHEAVAKEQAQRPTVVLDLGEPGNEERYKELTLRLHIIRTCRGDRESPEEDEVLDLMDVAWYAMTDEETERLEKELTLMRTLFAAGDRVRTVKPDKESTDWTPEALATRRWDVEGVVDMSHNSHGVTYEVRYDDGTIGHYEPRELVKVPSVVDGKDPA